MLYAMIFTAFFTALCTILAIWSVMLCRDARQQQRFPEKRLTEVELEAADLRDRLERLTVFAKKINARDASAAARERKKEPEPATIDQRPDETPAEWKARMRREIALKHFGGGNDGG